MVNEVWYGVVIECSCLENGVLYFFLYFLGRYFGDEMLLNVGLICKELYGSFLCIRVLGPASVDRREDKVLDTMLESSINKSLTLDFF